MSLTSLIASPPSGGNYSPKHSNHLPLNYNPVSSSSSPDENIQSSNHNSPSSSPKNIRSRSNTVINGLPSRNGGNDYHYQSTKSAPTSPQGRMMIHGLTPLSGINGLQLSPAQTHPHFQSHSHSQSHIQPQGYVQQPTPHQQQQIPQHGLMGPPTIPTHIQNRPAHIHSHSLPTSHHIPQLPPSAFHPPNQIQSSQHAGPSRQHTLPIPTPGSTSYTPTPAKSLMRARPRQSLSKQNAEDSGIDSDATVRPNRDGDSMKHKGSLSQPDLTALRSKRVEGWTEHVKGTQNRASPPTSSQQGDLGDGSGSGVGPGLGARRRLSYQRQKTPPSTSRTIQPFNESQNKEGWLPASPTNSRSHPSLIGLRKSPTTSPRHSQTSIPTMSPIIPNKSITPLSLGVGGSSSEEDEEYFKFISNGLNRRNSSGFPPIMGENGMSSEDADYETNSNNSEESSSGSITFSPKKTKKSKSNSNLNSMRNRFIQEKRTVESSPTSSISTGLGLTLNGDDDNEEPPNNNGENLNFKFHDNNKKLNLLEKLENKFRNSNLLTLRLLSIVPSLWGIIVLLKALYTGGLWIDVWPWGIDLTKEALEKLVAGGEDSPGLWRKEDRGDVLLSIGWAICTAHFCFSITTGLTHRWRSYYSLPSTITRLVSLQCLCWPATYLTLWFLGADRLLLCWVVIGVTTGCSRAIQMWVTSNVIPQPRPPRTNSLDHNEIGGGDLTPNLRRSNLIMGNGPPEIPEGLSFWESFIWGRKWDWDNVAREVGWKVGALLLVTCAWLFWGIEKGTRVRV